MNEDIEAVDADAQAARRDRINRDHVGARNTEMARCMICSRIEKLPVTGRLSAAGDGCKKDVLSLR